MDGATFDRLSALVGSGSRRLALRTALGGATVAAAGAFASAAGSDAKNKRKKCKKKLKKCKKKRKTCPTCQAKLVGEACTTTSECCGTETNMACALPSNPPPVPKTVCCGTATAPCTVDDDCCIGFECNVLSGQCRFAPK